MMLRPSCAASRTTIKTNRKTNKTRKGNIERMCLNSGNVGITVFILSRASFSASSLLRVMTRQHSGVEDNQYLEDIWWHPSLPPTMSIVAAPRPLTMIIKMAPNISSCPWGGKNHPKSRTIKLDRQAMQITDILAAFLRMVELRGTAVFRVWKDRK